MFKYEEIKRSFLVALWFMFLTFPILVIRVNTIHNVVEWRWANMFYIGIGAFCMSFIWRYLLKRKEIGKKEKTTGSQDRVPLRQRIFEDPKIYVPALIGV